MKEYIAARHFREDCDIYDDEPFIVNSFKIDEESKTIRISKDLDTKCVKVHNQHINATIISLFVQTRIEKCDMNPIVYSLKEKNGWKFDVTDKEISEYVDKVIAKYDFLNKKFDTLINIDYESHFTARFKQELEYKINSKDTIYDFFVDCSFDYEDLGSLLVNWDTFVQDFGQDAGRIYHYLVDCLIDQKYKRKFFLGKDFPKKYLKYFWDASKLTEGGVDYVSALRNKNIMIIDNESYSNEKLSIDVKAINRIFNPKSITVLKLF